MLRWTGYAVGRQEKNVRMFRTSFLAVLIFSTVDCITKRITLNVSNSSV
jgi:hypothetical protein